MTAVAPAPAEPITRLTHVTGLDGVRGLALAAVVIHHVVVRDPANPIKGAWISVDLFFVLSGFLITLSMLQRPELGDFLRRRFWRIAPAMAVFLLAYTIWSIGQPDQDQRFEWAFAGATQWINIQGAARPPFSPHIGHLWSLSAEVQFYVLWGVCLWWMLRRQTPRAVIVGALLVLFLLSWAERVVMVENGTLWNRPYFGPDTRSGALFVGCVLGLAYGWGWLRPRWWLAVLVAPTVAFLAWIVLTLTFLDERTYLWVLTVAALALAVVVASAAVRLPTPLRPLLEFPPFVLLGRISYSVYLWHLLIIGEVALRRPGELVAIAAIGIPLSLAVGSVSYVLVERPLMSAAGRARLRARFTG